jgi:TolA-binding protein
LEQKIDNQNGRIDRIESNQNAIRLAVEKRQENHNTGLQVFQGDGGLLLALGVVAVVCSTGYFYHLSARNEQIARMLADQIRAHRDPNLEEAVLKACMYTPVEKDVYRMVVG